MLPTGEPEHFHLPPCNRNLMNTNDCLPSIRKWFRRTMEKKKEQTEEVVSCEGTRREQRRRVRSARKRFAVKLNGPDMDGRDSAGNTKTTPTWEEEILTLEEETRREELDDPDLQGRDSP